ncbi:Isoleucine--tRNA ligase [bacterium AB1]|nr:Isoleucine--tRNA ligase [bacterium AB1]
MSDLNNKVNKSKVNKLNNLVPSIICFKTISMFYKSIEVSNININGPLYFLHDGPPYANGDLHIGHLLNRTMKDLIVRHAMLEGYNVHYMMGWDCHGLPIEQKAIQNLKTKNIEINFDSIRKESKEIANYYINAQQNQIQDGFFYKQPHFYTTKSFEYQNTILTSLFNLVKKCFISIENRPVYYSFEEKTNLALAEVEYAMIDYYSTFFLADIVNSELKIAIWTTQVWTIPGNELIIINKNHKYFIHNINGYDVISGENFAEKYNQHFKTKTLSNNKNISAEWILSQKYNIPLFGIFEKNIYHSDTVQQNLGTGITHIAPAHGFDDFIIYNNQYSGQMVKNCVDLEGYLIHPLLKEIKIGTQANQKIAQLLKDNNAIIYVEIGQHKNTVSWRSKKPVYIISTLQVTINLNIDDLRNICFNISDKVKIHANDNLSFVKSIMSRPLSWCISRQRAWGTPCMLIYNKKNYRILESEEINNYLLERVSSEGVDFWFDENERNKIFTLFNLDSNNYIAIVDILDVWFESGLTRTNLNKILQNQNIEYKNSKFVVCEGKDQERGWFQSLAILNYLLDEKTLAYNKLYTHGFVCTENGTKFSKSDSETQELNKIVLNETSPEIVRLMFVLQTYQNDVVVSKHILQYAEHCYKKIYNLSKYYINLHHYENNDIEHEVSQIDFYLRDKIKNYVDLYNKNIKNGHFSTAYKYGVELMISMSEFVTISKDILYCDLSTSGIFQSTLYTLKLFYQALVYIFYSTIPATILFLLNKKYPDLSTNQHYIDKISEYYKEITQENKHNIKISFTNIIKIQNEFLPILDYVKKTFDVGHNYELGLYYESDQEYCDIFKESLRRYLDISFVKEYQENEIVDMMAKKVLLDEKVIKLDSTFKIYIINISLLNIYSKCSRCWRYFQKEKHLNCKRCQQVEA